jgi:hypothetical protein
MDWIHLAQDKDTIRTAVYTVINFLDVWNVENFWTN